MKNSKKLKLLITLCAASLLMIRIVSYSPCEEEKEYYLFDRMGDLLLVREEKDIYLVMLIEARKKVRITKTHDIVERDAFFSRDGRYIFFEIDKSKYYPDGTAEIKFEYFRQPIDEDDKKRMKIEEDVYRDFKRERVADKYKSLTYLDLRERREEQKRLLETLTSKPEAAEGEEEEKEIWDSLRQQQ